MSEDELVEVQLLELPPRLMGIPTLRRWYLTQFLDQIDGAAPVPFSRYAAPPPT